MTQKTEMDICKHCIQNLAIEWRHQRRVTLNIFVCAADVVALFFSTLNSYSIHITIIIVRQQFLPFITELYHNIIEETLYDFSEIMNIFDKWHAFVISLKIAISLKFLGIIRKNESYALTRSGKFTHNSMCVRFGT